jgi:hypothetical protein
LFPPLNVPCRTGATRILVVSLVGRPLAWFDDSATRPERSQSRLPL